MTFDSASEATPVVVTLVLRLWRAGPPRQPQSLRYQATHVQTGDVAYFRSLDGVLRHVQRLADQLPAGGSVRPPLQFPPRRGV